MNAPLEIDSPPRPPFFREATTLWLISVFGVLCVIPYLIELGALDQAALHSGLGIPVLLAISVAQSAVLSAIAIGLGLWAARRLGLGAPIIEALLTGKRVEIGGRSLATMIVVGLITGGLIVALDLWGFAPLIADSDKLAGAHPPAWMGFLASFYGAINEELLLRLGLLSLTALGVRWIWRLVARENLSALPSGVFWAANILTAIVFGLGHLPATAAIIALTPVIVIRAIVLNGVAGLAFGWLYRRSGLESAMIAHFTADLVLHVGVPLIIAAG